MSKSVYCCFLISACTVTAFSQTGDSQTQRPRVVVTEQLPKPVAEPTPRPQVQTAVKPEQRNVSAAVRAMSFREIKSRIAEARRELQSRPLATSSSDPTSTLPAEIVRIAFHDWIKNDIDFVVMSKEAFLSTVSEKELVSESGKRVRARTIRGNGVNTPIILISENNENHLPLMVQYPVIRNGKYIETAYYMSTHPGLVTPEVVGAGRIYVRNVIDLARDRLKENGVKIQPEIVDIAERLAAVEHVDHLRFRTEEHKSIYDDIYTLFALNEGQTYRYSVSTAGAGGMVQMIPSTYRMVRSWHPNISLNPDFVAGMQDHVNASQAMLLYMQRTWNDLLMSQTIRDALANGTATQVQLMAAGYNSNPARLAGYINRGGPGWTNLIPRETRIYLTIYESIERHVPMTPRSK